MIIYKGKNKNVTLQAYYNLDNSYIVFDDNPLHNTTYSNVDIVIKEAESNLHGITFIENVIEISGQEPIECELVCRAEIGKDLIIGLCQDWG